MSNSCSYSFYIEYINYMMSNCDSLFKHIGFKLVKDNLYKIL